MASQLRSMADAPVTTTTCSRSGCSRRAASSVPTQPSCSQAPETSGAGTMSAAARRSTPPKATGTAGNRRSRWRTTKRSPRLLTTATRSSFFRAYFAARYFTTSSSSASSSTMVISRYSAWTVTPSGSPAFSVARNTCSWASRPGVILGATASHRTLLTAPVPAAPVALASGARSAPRAVGAPMPSQSRAAQARETARTIGAAKLTPCDRGPGRPRTPSAPTAP